MEWLPWALILYSGLQAFALSHINGKRTLPRTWSFTLLFLLQTEEKTSLDGGGILRINVLLRVRRLHGLTSCMKCCGHFIWLFKDCPESGFAVPQVSPSLSSWSKIDSAQAYIGTSVVLKCDSFRYLWNFLFYSFVLFPL